MSKAPATLTAEPAEKKASLPDRFCVRCGLPADAPLPSALPACADCQRIADEVLLAAARLLVGLIEGKDVAA